MSHDNGWIHVVPKKTGGTRLVRNLPLAQTPQGLNDLLNDDDLVKLRRKFASIKAEIQSSEFLKWLVKQVRRIMTNHNEKETWSVLCYGLGNPANDMSSLYQLVVLDLVIDQCKLDRSSTYLYDPIFREVAVQLFSELGMQVITENEKGMRKLRGPTFVFLPHVPQELTNNLLFANWSQEAVTRLVLFSNSWRITFENPPEPSRTSLLHYMHQLVECVETIPVPDPEENLNSYFNSMAVHHFPACKVANIGAEVWSMSEKPSYEGCSELLF